MFLRLITIARFTAEQSIVKWQPDKEATHCAICS
jgi:hypothetical protein